jgi:glucose-6-phosphate 1-dehydrogenase
MSDDHDHAMLLVNPLRAGLRAARTAPPNTVVIFGASGDLTQRKLVPALYNLALERLLPAGFAIVGFARRDIPDDQFREKMLDGVNRFSRNRPADPAIWDSFAAGMHYHRSTFTDADGYRRLADLLDEIDRTRGTAGNRLFYLATPPEYFPDILANLGAAGLTRQHSNGRGWTRVVIEKPFGSDLATAHELNHKVHAVLQESQVYRIDHYLGKETVQNILVFRFANGIFEPLWDRRYVDHVQITVSESVGVEGRAGFYESAGVIRDIIQNHMLQVMTLVAMEPPVAFEATAVRDEKVKVLRAIRPIEPDAVNEFTVRGQYGPGSVNGKRVPGYREEPKVAADSVTETFAAFKFYVDNWRWAGVPFYLRSGKRMPRRVTEVAIQFKQPPLVLFGEDALSGLGPNLLALRIQPDEGISLRFGSKVPGPTAQIRSVTMDFRYGALFGGEPPEAYERLLLDCMVGDSTLFARADEVETAWELITRIIEGWAAHPPAGFPNYAAGTWGPDEAEAFIEKDGRAWRRP